MGTKIPCPCAGAYLRTIRGYVAQGLSDILKGNLHFEPPVGWGIARPHKALWKWGQHFSLSPSILPYIKSLRPIRSTWPASAFSNTHAHQADCPQEHHDHADERGHEEQNGTGGTRHHSTRGHVTYLPGRAQPDIRRNQCGPAIATKTRGPIRFRDAGGHIGPHPLACRHGKGIDPYIDMQWVPRRHGAIGDKTRARPGVYDELVERHQLDGTAMANCRGVRRMPIA